MSLRQGAAAANIELHGRGGLQNHRRVSGDTQPPHDTWDGHLEQVWKGERRAGTHGWGSPFSPPKHPRAGRRAPQEGHTCHRPLRASG